MNYGFAGLYGTVYGDSTPIGSKPWPYSCWEVGSTGWVVAKDCRIDEKTTTSSMGAKVTTFRNKNLDEPYIEARPDSRDPKRWTPNAAILSRMKTASPTEKGSFWAKFDTGARIRAITGAMNTMVTSDQAAMNALTREYVPDYSDAYKLTQTLASTRGPAGDLAPGLWFQWVTGDVAMRKSVIQQIGAKVRELRGQDPTPPGHRTPSPPAQQEEQGEGEVGISPVLLGAGLLLAVGAGVYFWRR